MKKFLMIFTIVLIFSSCLLFPKVPEKKAKNTIFWDESIPKEQCIALMPRLGITITNYNGRDVNWGNKDLIYLPPGEATLIMNVSIYGATGYFIKNVPFKWAFHAGEIRYLMGDIREENLVILVIDPYDDTKWNKQSAFIIPEARGNTILQ